MNHLIGIDKTNGSCDVIGGVVKFQVMMAALDLGLFDVLDEQGASGREGIISATKLDDSFADTLLKVLVDCKLLEEENGEYRNGSTTSAYFVKSSPLFKGNEFMQEWGDLTSLIKAPDISWKIHLELIEPEVRQVINKIKDWNFLYRNCHLLDYSDPKGLYGIELSRLYTNIKPTILLDSEDLSFAEKLKEQEGVDQGIQFVGNDFTSLEPESFDMVILSHSLYKHRKELVPTLTEISKLVKRGGVLITNHFFCAPDCGEPSGTLQELSQSVFISGLLPLCSVDKFKEFITRSNFSLHWSGVFTTLFGDSYCEIAIKN